MMREKNVKRLMCRCHQLNYEKYTSVASLAVALSWKWVVLTMVLVCAAQWLVFDPFCVQTQDFESAIQGSLLSPGPALAGGLGVYGLMAAMAYGCRKFSDHTLGRLRISRGSFWLVFAAVYTGYFLVYWAVQAGWMALLFARSRRWSHESWNLMILAVYRSDYLHQLFPHGDAWGWGLSLGRLAVRGVGTTAMAWSISRGRKGWIGVLVAVAAMERLLDSVGVEGALFAIVMALLGSLVLLGLMGLDRVTKGGRPRET